jgi:RND family efflux transporter MFP subunit
LLLVVWVGAAPAALAREPVPVTVQRLEQVALYPQKEAPASVLSLNESVVAAEVAGRLTRMPARVGDRVARDAEIALIDCGDHTLAYERAEAALRGTEARLELARYQLGQAESLSRQRNVSEELLAQRRADLAVTEAQKVDQEVGRRSAQRSVEKCRVRAPFRAVVKDRLASEGEWRNPGEPVARLIDLEELEVSAQVEAGDVDYLQQAGSLSFSEGRRAYALTLRAILPAVDGRARTREVRLTFAGEAALPGTPGRLQWRSARPHVPADLLVRRGDALGVFTVGAGGKAEFRALPGALEGRPAATDLPPETPIVVDGRFALREGDPLTVSP